LRRYLYSALAAAAGLGLLALLVHLAGPRQTMEVLARLNAWRFAVLVLTAFGVSWFTALAWQAILARYGYAVPAWLLFRLTILAFAAGWAIPSGFVAGIPIAAWFLGRRGVPFSRALASFTISRFLEITAYVLILPAVLLTELGSRPAVRVAACAALAALAVVHLDVFFEWRLVRRTLARVRQMLPRSTHRSLDAAAEFCRTVTAFFHGPPGPILRATAYSFAAIGIAFVRAVLTNAFLRTGLTTPQLVVMFAITVFLMAIPFLPGAIGAYEGGIAGAFELLGRARSEGLAYAMTVHATELVVVIAGFVVLAHLGVGLVALRRQAAGGGRPPAAGGPRASGSEPPREAGWLPARAAITLRAVAVRQRTGVRAVRPPSRTGPVWDRRRREPLRAAEKPSAVADGLWAGLAGALTLAVWFLAADAVQGRPFHTPTVLGTALFRGGDGLATPDLVSPSFEMVLGFTWVHLMVFLLVGLAASRLLAAAERSPHLGFGVVLLFVLFEGGYLFGVMLLARPLLHALAWPAVAVGNLLAAAAMVVVLSWRRPGLTIWP
jgi:uncharacterized protein (TIRG00374 family)